MIRAFIRLSGVYISKNLELSQIPTQTTLQGSPPLKAETPESPARRRPGLNLTLRSVPRECFCLSSARVRGKKRTLEGSSIQRIKRPRDHRSEEQSYPNPALISLSKQVEIRSGMSGDPAENVRCYVIILGIFRLRPWDKRLAFALPVVRRYPNCTIESSKFLRPPT